MSSHTEMVSSWILQLELDPDHYDLRLQAQRNLLQLGPDIIPQLVHSLNHPNLWIVSSIIEIIGEFVQQNENTLPIPKLQLLDLLMPFLSTKELVILRKTINALVKIGDPKPIPIIVRLLCHDSWHVKACVADGISLFFEHTNLQEPLFHAFLDAYLHENNREDYLMRILSETGWNLDFIHSDPSLELKKILSELPHKGIKPHDKYLLSYFFEISVKLCECFMEINYGNPKFILYQTLHSQLEHHRTLCSDKNLPLFL